mmetsp:Transcript_29884/g.84250  ORF Transcript_29884/g.84250 Transcript_29884/m.84250 type:complete len:261 (-) Transcript_29884:634-1416(-)
MLPSFIGVLNVMPLVIQQSCYWPSGTVNAMQSLFQGSTEMAANLCVIGATPIMLSSLMLSSFQAFAKIKIMDQQVFPRWSQFFTKAATDPYVMMDVQVFGNFILLFVASAMAIVKTQQLDPVSLSGSQFFIRTAALLVFVCFALKHLAMEIDEHGLGQGLTFLISVNIINGLMTSLQQATMLQAQGLLPQSVTWQIGLVILLLVTGSVIVSRIQIKLRLVFYGKEKPVCWPVIIAALSIVKCICFCLPGSFRLLDPHAPK